MIISMMMLMALMMIMKMIIFFLQISHSKQVYFKKQNGNKINSILLSTDKAHIYNLHIRTFFDSNPDDNNACNDTLIHDNNDENNNNRNEDGENCSDGNGP